MLQNKKTEPLKNRYECRYGNACQRASSPLEVAEQKRMTLPGRQNTRSAFPASSFPLSHAAFA